MLSIPRPLFGKPTPSPADVPAKPVAPHAGESPLAVSPPVSAESRPVATATAMPPAAAPSRRGEADEWRDFPRILVVDDEPSVIDVFREFLSAQGYELSVAKNAEEAMRLTQELQPDIILTDINLPGHSGLDVMRHAKSLDPEVAVIVVTGYASASTAIDALRQGAYDYVTKPFDLDEVHQIVERGIANRRLKAINRQLVEELRQKNEILQHHEQELREKVAQATRQMTTLYDAGLAINTNLELQPRLDTICFYAAQLMAARGAIAYLKLGELDEFHAVAATGVALAPQDPADARLLEAGGAIGLARHALAAQREAAADSSITVRAVPGESFESVLAVPMMSDGELIGVLATFDKAGGFTEEDEAFITLFAQQTTISVRNSRLYEHAKSLDRLKSEFVAVVSHEIRTPLTSVKGALELLSDDRYFQNTEQQAKLLTIAHANAERLLVLINDILDFSKLEADSLPMNLERQPLEPLIEQVHHNMRTLIEEHRIHLVTTLVPDLPHLMIDANRIGQVLTNLLSNAIKFSPRGGRIEVIAEMWEDTVRVAVRDHGEGIAAQDLSKLFRKFSQIDSSATRRAGGTGLGLVICRGIVEQHDGKIWVESTVGQGSTFYFTLPASERHAPVPVSRP
jgi:signal transduction histidine kinase/DNA-binding response OmpR family regulator